MRIVKSIVVYTSKTGTTKRCALEVVRQLDNCEMVEIGENAIELDDYDKVIIGFPIRMGRMPKPMRQFLAKNHAKLITKQVAYFVCCGFSENYKTYFEQNINKELLDKSVFYTTFGGELDLAKQKGFDKFVVKMVTKNENQKHETKILYENINQLVYTIKEN